MDESHYIARFREGDAEALSVLVEQYRRPLYSVILNMTGGRQDADEIFQDVWLRAIRALPRYRHKGRFVSWLFKIAHHIIIDRARRERPTLSLDHPQVAHQDAGREDRDAADAVQASELGQRIRAAVARLPPEQREVFLLRMETDLPFKEIARIQRTSINTALARMSYALAKLRASLGDAYRELNR